jgi:tetratricopeptide (TPR) repeat protein
VGINIGSMHKNPAVQICHQLNGKQAQALKKILMQDKRSATLKLFNLIRSLPPKDIPKEDLYKKLYGTAYEPAKDYLLRNELRLLRQKLDKFLLQKSIETLLDEDEVFRQQMTLQAYKHYKLYDLFVENFDKASSAAEEAFRFSDVLEMQNWYLDLAYQHQFSAVRDYEEKAAFFKKMSDKAKKTLGKQLASQWRITEFYQGLEFYYQRLLGHTPDHTGKGADSISFDLSALEHPLSLYYHHRSLAFYTEGRDRLAHFLKAYKALQTHTPRDKHITDLLINILLGIGRTLQQLGDFEQADLYLSKAINDYSKEISALASRDKLYANYIINLLNIGEYEKTITVLQQLQKEVSDTGYAQYWYNIYKLTAYIGLRKTAEIKQLLPANYTTIPSQHRVYFRIISSIYFYLTGELEWAYKEAYNLLHTKLSEEYGQEQLAVTELLETFFQFIDKYSNLRQLPARESKKLEQKINAIDTSKINDINILPVYLWLKNEINRTIHE